MTSTKNPFFYLLGGLLIALLVAPITSERFPGIAGLVLTGTLLIATLSLAASKRMYVAAWSLAYLEAICVSCTWPCWSRHWWVPTAKSASPRLDTLAPSRRQPSSCSKPTSKWEPSQKGLFFDPPQRHRVKCSWELPSPNSVFSSLMPPVTT